MSLCALIAAYLARLSLLVVGALFLFVSPTFAQPDPYHCADGTWNVLGGDFDEPTALIDAPLAAAAAFGDTKPIKGKLTRTCKTAQGTFGILEIGDYVCFTIEPPDLGNKPFKSCIPEGVYTCKRRNSRRFGGTFEITGVENRSDVLFHGGNCAADSSGCVILGAKFDPKTNTIPGGFSRPAVKKFMEELLGQDSFELTICYKPPPTPTPTPTASPTPRPGRRGNGSTGPSHRPGGGNSNR